MKRFIFQTMKVQREAVRTMLCSAAVLGAFMGAAGIIAPAAAAGSTPEVLSRVWMENGRQIAAVYLDGQQIVAFRGASNGTSAADQAEDMALRLQEAICDPGFDVNQLLPAREGNKVAIKSDGRNVIEFGPDLKQDDDAAYLTIGIRVVNALRRACGAPMLPESVANLPRGSAVAGKGGHHFSGHASWYGPRFHGRRTSDGSRFDMNGLTAAHRTLPFGTKLLVMNRRTGNSVIVEVNDRGPFIAGRVLDLSRGAAQQLDMLNAGVAVVDCVVLGSR